MQCPAKLWFLRENNVPVDCSVCFSSPKSVWFPSIQARNKHIRTSKKLTEKRQLRLSFLPVTDIPDAAICARYISGHHVIGSRNNIMGRWCTHWFYCLTCSSGCFSFQSLISQSEIYYHTERGHQKCLSQPPPFPGISLEFLPGILQMPQGSIWSVFYLFVPHSRSKAPWEQLSLSVPISTALHRGCQILGNEWYL